MRLRTRRPAGHLRCTARTRVVPARSAVASPRRAPRRCARRRRNRAALDKPARVSRHALYKCTTQSGRAAYFNVPDAAAQRRAAGATRPRASRRDGAPAPRRAAFRASTPRRRSGRDDVRRKVLERRARRPRRSCSPRRAPPIGDGAPTPLPEEQADAEKYRERIARLRQAVALHERNVEALQEGARIGKRCAERCAHATRLLLNARCRRGRCAQAWRIARARCP